MNELSKFFASIAALIGAVAFAWAIFDHGSLVTVNLDVPSSIQLEGTQSATPVKIELSYD